MNLTEQESKELLRNLDPGASIEKKKFARTKFRWPVKHLEGVRFEDSDLGAPLLGGLLRRPRLSQCVFRNCAMDGLNLSSTTIVDTEFSGSTIGKEFHAAFNQCKLSGSTFADCWMSYTGFNGCQVTGCRLQQVKGSRLRFENTSIDRCEFSGSPGIVHFIKCEITSTEFSSFSPGDMCFVGCTFRDTEIPENGHTEVL